MEFSREKLLELASRFKRGERIYQRDEPMLKISRILNERKVKYLTYFEIVRIAAFVNPLSCAFASANEPNIVKHTTEEAFLLDSPEDMLRKLMELEGIGIEEGSFILSLFDREKYPFINLHAYRAVFGKSIPSLTSEDYSAYYEEVEALRKRVNLEAYTLSRALTVAGEEYEDFFQH